MDMQEQIARGKRAEEILREALDWVFEHINDEEEYERVLREHFGMTEEEIAEAM